MNMSTRNASNPGRAPGSFLATIVFVAPLVPSSYTSLSVLTSATFRLMPRCRCIVRIAVVDVDVDVEENIKRDSWRFN